MVNRINKGCSGHNPAMAEAKSPMGARMGNSTQNRQSAQGGNELLKQLQMVDFALVETVLYLDAYPNCAKALDYYKKLLQKRESLCAALKAAGIPLNNMSNSGSTWTWTDSPWPWELEANL